MITLTRKKISEFIPRKGGINKQQMDLLGQPWPPKKGWVKALIGIEITYEQAERLIELKGSHLTAKKTNQRKDHKTTGLMDLIHELGIGYEVLNSTKYGHPQLVRIHGFGDIYPATGTMQIDGEWYRKDKGFAEYKLKKFAYNKLGDIGENLDLNHLAQISHLID